MSVSAKTSAAPNYSALSAEVHGTTARLDKLEETFEAFASNITGKIDRLFNELTRQQALPRYEPGKILAVIMQCVMLIGAVVGGAGFVINAYSSAELARHDERQKALLWRVEYLEKQRERDIDRRLAQLQVTK